ncbi:MAG TPA: dienelactone hydrolase family protein [Aliidongia sp.]|uniref:alpha/beta hydrolase n=1 Tax=Aliidongia sp. TaxID=1914230 RepID=UPI002DDCAA9D|nr:dienelactone hydrolase family protein [Aliidongia sp.]HEV2675294.1 dienelactone hydrolase family protein [Aliidongia sp.]
MSQPLTGPSRAPASGGKPTSLVVLLHGLGADGQDLIDLAQHLGPFLPDTAFVAPNAPEPCDMGPYGYQWFSLQQRIPALMAAGADRAAPLLSQFIEAQLAARGLDARRLALVGFSQGTMMSLHVGPRLSPGPAAIVGFSGALVAPERLVAEHRSTPPVLLIHGEADQVVPFQAMDAAANGLVAAGIVAETVRRPGLGHGIDGPGLEAAAQFLTRYLGGPSQG